MMQSHFYHVQINIDYSKNSQFYRELMTFLGWSVIFENDKIAGYKSSASGDIWFVDSIDKETVSYDKIGINHISIRVGTQANLDQTIDFLKAKSIETLFNTPRHRPEFTSNDKETYYQIIFETPDKIQFEIVYIGPKE